MTNDLITPREAARLLVCHLATIYRYLLTGKLAGIRRAGGHWLIERSAVLALLVPVRPTQREKAIDDRIAATLRRAGFTL